MESTESDQIFQGKFQSVFMVAGKLAALVASFGIPLILTRLLSQSDYGIFAQFYVVVFFCTGIFNVSMQSNLYYFYPTASGHSRRTLIFQTLLFLLVVSVIAGALVAIPGISRYLIGDGELVQYRKYILAAIVLLMPVYMVEPLYVVKKDVLTSLIYPPSEVLLRFLLITALVLIKPGVQSAFNGILIAAGICLVFTFAYTLKEIGLRNLVGGLLNRGLARDQLRYSIPFGAATSLNILFQRFDKIICISFLSPGEFAVYAIAFYGIPGVLQVFDSLAQIYLVRMTVKHQQNKTSELASIYRSLVTKTCAFSLPVMLVVALYARKIIALLFTDKYQDAVPLFRVYLMSIFIFMLCSGLILRATGNTNYTLKSYLYSGVIILPATYFLIRFFGVWGAMTGALISLSLPKLLNLRWEMQVLKKQISEFFPWKQFGQISLIAVVSILPFAAAEMFFNYGLFFTMLLGTVYLVLVSMLEIKYKLFPADLGPVKASVLSYFRFLNPVWKRVGY